MLDRLRSLFRPSPRTVTVYPNCSGGWAVQWREANVLAGGLAPTERDRERKDEALAFAGRQVARLQRNGVRTELVIEEDPPQPEAKQ